jgi:hypothetical protein
VNAFDVGVQYSTVQYSTVQYSTYIDVVIYLIESTQENHPAIHSTSQTKIVSSQPSMQLLVA